MAKGSSGLAAPVWNARRSPVNTGAPWPAPKEAQDRVLGIQRKLHKWASDDPNRRFKDLHNLVCDPATLMMAWLRVRSNRGSRSAGVDGQTARHVEQQVGVQRFLDGLREELRSGSFRPLPVKERLVPKRGGNSGDSGCLPFAIAWFRPPSRRCSSRSSRPTSNPAPTGSGPDAAPMTRSPRYTCSRPTPTSGFSKQTSRRASTKSGSPGMIGGDDTRTRVFFLALRTASPVFRHDARSTPG